MLILLGTKKLAHLREGVGSRAQLQPQEWEKSLGSFNDLGLPADLPGWEWGDGGE